MGIDLIAGPAMPYRERSTYYKGGGKGGGGAFGRRSLTDMDFESMLPGYADALLGSGLDSGSRAGVGDVASRAADVARAKLKLQLGGGAVTPYDPEDFANVRPGVFDPRRTVPVPRITIRKPAQRAKIAQAIARDVRRMADGRDASRAAHTVPVFVAAGWVARTDRVDIRVAPMAVPVVAASPKESAAHLRTGDRDGHL